MILQVEDRGISLRFPRFVRIRDDKSADDATGPEQVSYIWCPETSVNVLRNGRLQKCMSVKHYHRAMARKRKVMMLLMTISGRSTIKIGYILCNTRLLFNFLFSRRLRI